MLFALAVFLRVICAAVFLVDATERYIMLTTNRYGDLSVIRAETADCAIFAFLHRVCFIFHPSTHALLRWGRSCTSFVHERALYISYNSCAMHSCVLC